MFDLILYAKDVEKSAMLYFAAETDEAIRRTAVETEIQRTKNQEAAKRAELIDQYRNINQSDAQIQSMLQAMLPVQLQVISEYRPG
jgi:hypothetical protein